MLCLKYTWLLVSLHLVLKNHAACIRIISHALLQARLWLLVSLCLILKNCSTCIRITSYIDACQQLQRLKESCFFLILVDLSACIRITSCAETCLRLVKPAKTLIIDSRGPAILLWVFEGQSILSPHLRYEDSLLNRFAYALRHEAWDRWNVKWQK